MTVNNIHVFCQGESHKDSEKPCQDYAYSEVDDKMAIAVVCDGHGGERYFRSQFGSQFATEVIVQAVKDFVKNTDAKLFKGLPYTAEGVVTQTEKKLNDVDKHFRQLFASIITLWNEKIEEHAKQTPLSEWELEHVPQKYLDEFTENLVKTEQTSTLNKQYGCTLMAYVQTNKYWFAFHLGDGKCLSFHHDTNLHGLEQVWDEPIPWDERCFLNKTTSICDSDAINEFRYCYQGDGNFPVAVFLGSDGIDDTYGEMENIANFYIEIMKVIAKDGVGTARQQLIDDLPIISRIGSKDDVSVATIFNMAEVRSNIGRFIDFQIQYVHQQAEEQRERIGILTKKKQKLDSSISSWHASTKKADIERGYAVKDLIKAAERLEVLSGKIDFLLKEHKNLTGREVQPDTDYSEIIEQAKEEAAKGQPEEEHEVMPDIINDPDDLEILSNDDVISGDEPEQSGPTSSVQSETAPEQSESQEALDTADSNTPTPTENADTNKNEEDGHTEMDILPEP